MSGPEPLSLLLQYLDVADAPAWCASVVLVLRRNAVDVSRNTSVGTGEKTNGRWCWRQAWCLQAPKGVEILSEESRRLESVSVMNLVESDRSGCPLPGSGQYERAWFWTSAPESDVNARQRVAAQIAARREGLRLDAKWTVVRVCPVLLTSVIDGGPRR